MGPLFIGWVRIMALFIALFAEDPHNMAILFSEPLVAVYEMDQNGQIQ